MTVVCLLAIDIVLSVLLRFTDSLWYLQTLLDLICPVELVIKDVTDTTRSASYIVLHIEIGVKGRLKAKLYDKRADSNIPIVNVPFMCSKLLQQRLYI